MIVNGNYYQNGSAGTSYSKETDQADALASHIKTDDSKSSSGVSDKVELSPEAQAALKEHAPEALTSLGFNGLDTFFDDKNPVLDEVKEIAKEKYFHFGSQYLNLPDNQDDMVSALDVANRYMDALNEITPDDIYQSIADANLKSAESNSVDYLKYGVYG